MSKFFIHNSQIYEEGEHKGITFSRKSAVVVPSVTTMPKSKWTGGKIPVALWRQILAFFKWSYDTTHSETQVRLFYNFDTGEWRAHAFPQEKNSGMTTRELPDHPNRAVDEQLFIGFEPWGTVHHHCGACAFQSGTDKDNEESQAGLHVTVGLMDRKEHDLHTRVTIVIPGEIDPKTGALIRPAEKAFLETELESWFMLPDDIANRMPSSLHNLILNHYLKSAAEPHEEFPARWKENVIELPRPIYNLVPAAVVGRGGVTQIQHEFEMGGSRVPRPTASMTDAEIEEAHEAWIMQGYGCGE